MSSAFPFPWVSRAGLQGIKVWCFPSDSGRSSSGQRPVRHTAGMISAIPLGGYVKLLRDENVASVPDANAVAAMNTDERRVSSSSIIAGCRPAQRWWRPGRSANFPPGDRHLRHDLHALRQAGNTARSYSFWLLPGRAAEAAGFQSGDLVLSIDGKPIDTFKDMQEIVALNRTCAAYHRGGAGWPRRSRCAPRPSSPKTATISAMCTASAAWG